MRPRPFETVFGMRSVVDERISRAPWGHPGSRVRPRRTSSPLRRPLRPARAPPHGTPEASPPPLHSPACSSSRAGAGCVRIACSTKNGDRSPPRSSLKIAGEFSRMRKKLPAEVPFRIAGDALSPGLPPLCGARHPARDNARSPPEQGARGQGRGRIRQIGCIPHAARWRRRRRGPGPTDRRRRGPVCGRSERRTAIQDHHDLACERERSGYPRSRRLRVRCPPGAEDLALPPPHTGRRQGTSMGTRRW